MTNPSHTSTPPFPAQDAKIHDLDSLASLLSRLKGEGRRIVHCHGVFDLLHPGHIRHLQAARGQGDVLVVTITADTFVNKGPGRPAFNHHLRAHTLAAIAAVDYVAINPAPTAMDLIRRLRPDVYVKGSDYRDAQSDPTGMISEEEKAVLSVGGRIHFTDEVAFSSSTLINAHLNVFAPETEAWLRAFRARHSLDEVMDYVEQATALKALVIGEPIIDEYVFCSPLGKSSKDPILAVQYHSLESHAGGTLAIANHLAGIVGSVGLLAELGEIDRQEDFILRHLQPKVTPRFLTRRGAPTIHKRRFLDQHTGSRLLELYVMDDVQRPAGEQQALADLIRAEAPAYDLVVVADYGHGMMSPAAVAAVEESARFLVLNTQANAGNRGYNTVSKYRRADYICLAAHEVELEGRLRHARIDEMRALLARSLDARHFTITRGRAGTAHFDAGDSPLVEVPALATQVTDRVGAGDAVLAVTGALISIGAPWDVVGFVGNIAGAILVADLGNRVAVTQPTLRKAITALMK